MTYCTMTYSPSDGTFLVYDYNPGPYLDSSEWINVYEINVEAEYGVECIASFNMEEKDGNRVYSYSIEGQEYIVNEVEYAEKLKEYNDDEIALETPYEITVENLDKILPIMKEC